MLLINCPWCGPRDETEFHYGSEAHIGYPEKPEELTDKQYDALKTQNWAVFDEGMKNVMYGIVINIF